MSSVKKNFFYSSILTSANYVFPLIIYPYISRVLGVSNIGAVNFVDGLINYFILFSMMGISATGIRATATYKKDRSKLNSIFSSLITLNFITTLIAFIILVIAIEAIPSLSSYKNLLYIGALKLLFNLFLIEWFFKGLEAFKFITKRTIIIRCIFVASIFLFVRSSQDIFNYYLLLVGTIIVNSTVNLWYSRKFVTFNVKEINLKDVSKPFFQMGIYLILTSMYTSFNVVYLGFVGGDTEVGYYTTATKIYTILLSVFTAFTGVMLPRMSALLANGMIDEFKKYINKSASLLFSFSIPLAIFAILFAPQIIQLISGEGYEGAILPMRLTLPLILIIGYEQILVIQMLMPLQKDKIILKNSFIVAILGIILNILLVNHLYCVGSAIVWICCEITLLILSQISIKRAIGFTFPIRQLTNQILVHTPLIIILWIIYQLNIRYLAALVLGGIATLIYSTFVNLYIIKNPLFTMTFKCCRK